MLSFYITNLLFAAYHFLRVIYLRDKRTDDLPPNQILRCRRERVYLLLKTQRNRPQAFRRRRRDLRKHLPYHRLHLDQQLRQFFIRFSRMNFSHGEFRFFKITVDFAFCAYNMYSSHRSCRTADHIMRTGCSVFEVHEYRLVVHNIVVAFVNASAIVAVAFKQIYPVFI